MNSCVNCSRTGAETKLKVFDGRTLCADADACTAFRQACWRSAAPGSALRTAAAKPSERRSGPPSCADKQAHFAAGGTATGAAPAAVKAPVAAPIRKRTAEEILNGIEARDEEEPTATAAKSSPISTTAEAAWRRLQAAVESGDAEAMCQACLDYADAMGLQIKSHRLTAEQILNGEGGSASRQLSAERERLHRSLERIGARKMTVTVTDDEDEGGPMDDEAGETESGAAANLALTTDQAYYWERLQSVVSGSGGISDSLETAARNFYNACSIGILAGA